MIRKKGGQCRDCYNKIRNSQGYFSAISGYDKKYPCRNNCGRKTKNNGGLCTVCYDNERLELGEIQQIDKNRRQQLNYEKTVKYLKTAHKIICPEREGLGHYWEIGEDNYALCIACGAEKDFRAIQKRLQIPQIISAGSYS